jgi:hypothetical protein
VRFVVLALAAVAGCGGNGTKIGSDLAMAPGDMATSGGKLCVDARADAWTLPATPMKKMSQNGVYQVSLLASAASPPIIGDLTSWTLAVADASGADVSGATFMTKCLDNSVKPVCPWMPDHHHGTGALANVAPASVNGQYTVEPLYLFMAGYWTITATITSGSATDSVVFSACLSDI